MGYTALLIFAGLQAIPSTVYEAGKVDGASQWTMFWRITMPLLRPILTLVLIMTIIGSFQVFDTVSVTTQGGPVNATRVLQYLHLRHGLQSFPVRLRLGHGRRTAQGRPTPRPAGGRASAESSPGS